MITNKTGYFSVAFLLAASLVAIAQSEFMPVQDVKAGMTGVVRTTFQGTQVEEIEAEVLGILPDIVGAKFDLIIVKLKGERVEFQGVAGGMSGSPFFIDGKLVGALSYRLGSFPKEPIAGVTPINDMLNTQYGGSGAPQVAVDYYRMFSASPAAKALAERLGRDLELFKRPESAQLPADGLRPLNIQIGHNGLNPAVIQQFAPFFRSAGLQLASAGTLSNGGQDISGELQPGMPVSVLFMTGDLEVGSSGTVTHIDGNRIWAYGHPFTQLGSVQFILARAEMLTVLTSLEGSNNLTRSGQAIGSITQDRLPAIYGEIGGAVDTFDLQVEVKRSGTTIDTYDFDVTKGKLLAPALVAMAVTNALYATQGQIGPMAATLIGEVELEGHGTVKIDNFYSGQSVINDVSFLPASLYFFLDDNEFEKVNFKSMRLVVDLIEDLREATIERAYLTKTEIKPGEQFQLVVEYRPRRSNRVEVKRENYFIPSTLQPGVYNIVVGNGSAISAQENAMVRGQIKLRDLNHMIRLANTLRTNNRIYAQTIRAEEGVYFEGDFFPSLPPSALSVIRTNAKDDAFVGLTGTVMDERRIETEYMINGVKRLQFTVKR